MNVKGTGTAVAGPSGDGARGAAARGRGRRPFGVQPVLIANHVNAAKGEDPVAAAAVGSGQGVAAGDSERSPEGN